MVPDSGSQVLNEGYQADKLSASLICACVIFMLFPFTKFPPLRAGSAPEEKSPDSVLRYWITSERRPAVLGVAKDVPLVS